MRRLIPVIAALVSVFLIVVIVRAGAVSQSADVRPGECAPSIQYTQRFQFMPTAYDANEYLKFITDYHGCDVVISAGHEEGTDRDGFYIWYRLPPLADK